MMTTQETREANPMAATWTKAGKVRRAFKAGPTRKKDRILTPTEAIFESGIVLHKLRAAMEDARLSADDVQVALVLMTPDTPGKENLVYVIPVPVKNRFSKIFSIVDKLGKVLPLGLAIHQRDREAYDARDPKSGAVVWMQPFLTGPRAVRALIQARAVYADGKGGKSEFN